MVDYCGCQCSAIFAKGHAQVTNDGRNTPARMKEGGTRKFAGAIGKGYDAELPVS